MHKAIRIVLVDDNTDFMEILNEYLSKKEGFEIVGTAANGLEAIAIIESAKPDVVLLDVVMPQLDGLGVLEKFNSLPIAKKPQFIMLSAIGLNKTVQIALGLGAEFFMIKPFDLEDLVSRIRQFQDQDKFFTERPVTKKRTPAEEVSISLKIKQMLDRIGVPAHLKGYQYLIYAIKMVVEDLTAISSITKLVYVGIAQEYGTTPTRAERAIRNAIELTWSRGNLDSINALFRHDLDAGKSRPSNSEFITMVADHFWKKPAAS